MRIRQTSDKMKTAFDIHILLKAKDTVTNSSKHASCNKWHTLQAK